LGRTDGHVYTSCVGMFEGLSTASRSDAERGNFESGDRGAGSQHCEVKRDGRGPSAMIAEPFERLG